ncbi:MAG: acyltransferase family protein [Polyangiaceae bacterium]|nr:acyltransferase family protein [Polyangiaceae bacterium]
MSLGRRLGHVLSDLLLEPRQKAALGSVAFRDAGHGFDVLGFDPEAFALALGLTRFAYERYFRVTSHGAEHLPRSGAAILAANHSGLLPIDGAMIVVDVARQTSPPRVARVIGDVFIPLMPWVGTAFSRVGVVAGSAGNFRHLLESGELVLVFPEGAPGIGKGWKKRYQLQSWRVGHAELALRHRAPVVPVAVIGAEEAWPEIGRLDAFHAFGAPFLPIPATPLPLPVRLHIHYGEPLVLHERFGDADDPAAVRDAALVVEHAVEALIAQGLGQREGLW